MTPGGKIRALVVDDEPVARDRIVRLLQEQSDIELVGECSNGLETVTAIEQLLPDLVFLDVQMPEMNGFDVVRALEAGHVPAVVFVTAYDEYALRAFEVHALDYLLKPFTAAASRRPSRTPAISSIAIPTLSDTPNPARFPERLLVRSGTGPLRPHLGDRLV